MSEEDFQIIITNDDYEKLKGHETENKKLLEENKKLAQQVSSLKQKNKDLNRSVYVRDSFIDYMVNQCDYAFGTMLNMAIISSDITQSFYQDVVSHEQNGISSIQLREAMELYIQKNRRIFDRLNDVQSKFKDMEKKIIQVEIKTGSKKEQSKIKQSKPQIKVEGGQKINPSNSDIKNKAKQLDSYTHEINNIKHDILKLKQQREKLDKQTERLKNKNIELNKQNQSLNRKRETQGEKSYVIKLLVDQYYGQLERNLIKMGGLTDTEIGTVVANQMKGIIQYINNLAKKACRP